MSCNSPLCIVNCPDCLLLIQWHLLIKLVLFFLLWPVGLCHAHYTLWCFIHLTVCTMGLVYMGLGGYVLLGVQGMAGFG